jgi:8-oxo-dGTP pyrophosphatase MutT (NUDIX family)
MPSTLRQAAAIPVRDGMICLVNSRNGRRWVIPKGQIDPGQTAGEAALIEAWEEAGLLGVLDAEPVGSYHYEKLGQERHVTVFLMRVTEQKSSWPEDSFRRPEWVTPDEAIKRIEEPGLRMLIRSVIRTNRDAFEEAYSI